MQLYNGAKPSGDEASNGPIGTEAIGWLALVNTNTAVAIEETVQRPIQEEIRMLKEDGKAAAEFLLACVPVDLDTLGRNERP